MASDQLCPGFKWISHGIISFWGTERHVFIYFGLYFDKLTRTINMSSLLQTNNTLFQNFLWSIIFHQLRTVYNAEFFFHFYCFILPTSVIIFFLTVTKLGFKSLKREHCIISDILYLLVTVFSFISWAVGGQSFFFQHLFEIKVPIGFNIRDDIAASLSAN